MAGNIRTYVFVCVLCISCEQKNICAFFHICFLPYVQSMPCELALKANSHGMFSIYVFGAYENISSEIEICTVFLTTCGKHTK